mmetsp:Transcript_11169/g.35647  ORF Transcript_11169/g.35647 Transcript_11169/m.35647 type:complete len:247 (-) Transcript_11169:100-840(-)
MQPLPPPVGLSSGILLLLLLEPASQHVNKSHDEEEQDEVANEHGSLVQLEQAVEGEGLFCLVGACRHQDDADHNKSCRNQVSLAELFMEEEVGKDHVGHHGKAADGGRERLRCETKSSKVSNRACNHEDQADQPGALKNIRFLLMRRVTAQLAQLGCHAELLDVHPEVGSDGGEDAHDHPDIPQTSQELARLALHDRRFEALIGGGQCQVVQHAQVFARIVRAAECKSAAASSKLAATAAACTRAL